MQRRLTVSRRIAAGETGREPAPKEQPPRKLSGRWTARCIDSGKRRDASADGIILSGKDTEGAPNDQQALMRCPNASSDRRHSPETVENGANSPARCGVVRSDGGLR
jgi:hypothetical protein